MNIEGICKVLQIYGSYQNDGERWEKEGETFECASF